MSCILEILQRRITDDVILKKEMTMLWTIFVVLLILWLHGMVTSTTFGGFIHLLLLIAVAGVLIRIIQGRQPLHYLSDRRSDQPE